MIDFLKGICEIISFQELKDRIQTPFVSEIDLNTGLLIPRYDNNGIKTYWHKCNLGEITILVKEWTNGDSTRYFVTVKGSIHKNHFKGSNFQDFTFDMVLERINAISNLLGVNSENLKLQNLEFGVNIQTPFGVSDFLTKNLICDSGYPFNRYQVDKNNISLGYEHQRAHYTKKLYDKGLQNGLDYEVMRYELSYKKMKELNKLGIHSLQDLTNINNIAKFKPLLLAKWNEILIQEQIIANEIKALDSNFLKKATNPKFWEQSKQTENYREDRRKFKKLQSAYCSNLQGEIQQLIEDKIDYLMTN